MKRYNCIALFAVAVVCLLVLLSGSLAYPVSAQTRAELRVAIVQRSENVWSTVVDTFERDHPGIKVELVILPITDLRERLYTSVAARRPDFDVVIVQQAWLCEFAEMGLEDLTEHGEDLRIEGIASVRCNDKIFGGEWPQASGWVVSVFKLSRYKELAFDLLLASCKKRVVVYFADAGEVPGSVYGYNTATGRETVIYTRPARRLYTFTFAPWAPEKLYFVNANENKIYQKDLVGALPERIISTHTTYVRDIVAGKKKTIYFSEATGARADGKIWRLGSDGSITLFFLVRLRTVDGFWAGHFTFDEEGTLYLSSGNRIPASIYKVDLRMGTITKIFTDGSEPIAGMAFGEDGLLYYANWRTKIYCLNLATGHRSTVYENPRRKWLSDVAVGVVRPAPRLDDVTVSHFSISSNKASMILMAHGANIDVGAKIRINMIAQDSFLSRLLRNPNMNATDPSTLGYPIFHYCTVWCSLSDQPPDTDISVTVENLDGRVSNSVQYHIARNMDRLDSDGDGLYDHWETNGYDPDGDGVVDVDLPNLGADPLRKDLFVEVDWMAQASPNNAIWAAIENAFANAPILNSDGSQGIAIHIDRGLGTGGGGGDIIPYADAIRYDNNTPNPNLSYTNFYAIKQNNFDNNRLKIYRYCVFAWDNGHFPGSSGQAEGIWANDFFVSLGNWGANGQRPDFQTGTFMHELGHTLNLRHGGSENTNYKLNYNSIMKYRNDGFGSPDQFHGIDDDCNMYDFDYVYTYSQGQRRDLDESNFNENEGICDNIDVDWNRNGIIEANVAVNIDGNSTLTVIQDYADWANIELDFRAPGSGWNNN